MKNFNEQNYNMENLIDMDDISEAEQQKLDTLKNVVETETVGKTKVETKCDEENDGRSRKSKMKRRPDEWNTAKEELAKELGLWDKVQSDGWAGLTASESGKLGGRLSAKFPGKAPKLDPKPRTTSAKNNE